MASGESEGDVEAEKESQCDEQVQSKKGELREHWKGVSCLRESGQAIQSRQGFISVFEEDGFDKAAQ